MAKHYVWLCAVVVLVAAAVVCADDEGKPIQAKIFVGRPILKTKDVDEKAFETLNAKDEQPMIKIEPAAKVDDKKEEGAEQLPPIMPFFNSMSPFIKSIIGGDAPVESSDPNAPVVDEEMPSRPRGVLTIVFMKAMRPSVSDADDDSKPKDPASTLLEAKSSFNLILSRILPQRLAQIFGGPTDPDSRPMRLIGGDDVDRNFMQSQHLLGGDHDIDRFRPFMEDPSGNGDSSDESSPFNQGAIGPQIIIRTDSSQSGNGADLADDMVRNYPPTNRCVMSFMRLKASAYYRTVVHLLFFSGIILLVLFMIILTIRVYRRRRALRFYNQNMHVATISYEDVPSSRKTANGNLFLFRLGNLRNSYAQKQADQSNNNNEYKSSLLVQSPPAYEQVIAPGTNKPQDEDAKSLPAYDEALLVEKKPKSSDV